MKTKLIFFEFALSLVSLLLGLLTGLSLVGKPLRVVDALLILALGIAGGAGLVKALLGRRAECRRGADADRDP